MINSFLVLRGAVVTEASYCFDYAAICPHGILKSGTPYFAMLEFDGVKTVQLEAEPGTKATGELTPRRYRKPNNSSA